MSWLKIKLKTWAILVIAVVGVVLLGKLVLFPGKSIPVEFAEARLKGAAVAQTIVVFSGSALKSLETIAQYDKRGDTSEALILISRELIKNRDTHDAAIKLSVQLEKMARNISDIRPASARHLATEALSSEVALVSRLLTYNDYLNQLFEVLRAKFSNPYYRANGKVAELIDKINEEAKAINELDKKSNDAILEFDKIFIE